MLISPSVASFNVLKVAEEVTFIDQYFDDIHIDIEDGMAVEGISFGMKMCKGICDITTSRTSIHLEVLKPLNYLDDVKKCNPNIVFIQADVLDNPLEVVLKFKEADIPVGIAIGDQDKDRDYSEIFKITNHVLVCTAYHDDPSQIYQPSLEKLALSLFNEYNMQVWIDGGLTLEKYEELKDSDIYAAVMGRAIYQNKDKIAATYKKR